MAGTLPFCIWCIFSPQASQTMLLILLTSPSVSEDHRSALPQSMGAGRDLHWGPICCHQVLPIGGISLSIFWHVAGCCQQTSQIHIRCFHNEVLVSGGIKEWEWQRNTSPEPLSDSLRMQLSNPFHYCTEKIRVALWKREPKAEGHRTEDHWTAKDKSFGLPYFCFPIEKWQ